jgi:ribonuclease HI
MEIFAILQLLENLPEQYKNEQLLIYTDSAYVVSSFNEYLPKWKTNGWKTVKKTDVKHKLLWTKLDNLSQKYKIQILWVKGHSTNKFNNYVDKLAQGFTNEN